jgi:predicted RNA-binding protein Jag
MELTKETADEIVKALAQLDNNEQNTMVDAMGENNKEFVAFANNPTEVTTELKKRIKTKGTRKEKITKTEMNDLLSTIPDDFD